MTNAALSKTWQPGTVAFTRGATWFTDGFDYFRKNILAWIGVTILLFIITLALSFVPLIGNLAGQILWPVFIAGLMLGCHTRAQGGEFEVAHLFAGFNRNTGQLLVLGLLYLAGIIGIVILLVILIIFGAGSTGFLNSLDAGNIAALKGNTGFIVLMALIAAALYVPLLMAFWFAPALVILRNASAVEAMKLSFNGCLLNIMPFLLYGLIGLVLTIVAIIPIGLGLVVLIPVITASIYAAYRDIFSEH